MVSDFCFGHRKCPFWEWEKATFAAFTHFRKVVQSWFKKLFWNRDCNVVSNLFVEITIYNFDLLHSALHIAYVILSSTEYCAAAYVAKIWRWVLQTPHLTRLKPAQLAASGSLHPDRDGSLQGRPSLEISCSTDCWQICNRANRRTRFLLKHITGNLRADLGRELRRNAQGLIDAKLLNAIF